jgi:hypothetical protein
VVTQLDWALLGLAIFSAIGVLYLIIQSLFDVIPWLSYGLDIEPVLTSGTQIGTNYTRNLVLNFTVWNETSRDATMQCNLVIPLERTEKVKRWDTLDHLRMVDADSSAELNMNEWVVRARNGRRLAISGEVRPTTPDLKIVEFVIHDDRIKWRKWRVSKDLTVPAFPKPTISDMLSAGMSRK